jgi:hypothetical protein
VPTSDADTAALSATVAAPVSGTYARRQWRKAHSQTPDMPRLEGWGESSAANIHGLPSRKVTSIEMTISSCRAERRI